MIHAKGHDVSMEPNEIKRMFHIATISSKIPCHTYIKNTKSLYLSIYKFFYDFVELLYRDLRDKQYMVIVSLLFPKSTTKVMQIFSTESRFKIPRKG